MTKLLRSLTKAPNTMKVFTQKFNPLNGRKEWMIQEENYDYHQEVARSSYADMLHDKERNYKYYGAIRRAVAKMKQSGRSVKVLDIGTGTGLLSMMAVRCGAECVVACEAFQPVAKCALQVIKDNGYENKIKVIPKRSTELTVGPDGDMPERANILVTEVFDTELIGEGALGTFRHALSYLLEDDSIVVPASATVYAQVIESSLVSSFNKLSPIHVDEKNSVLPPNAVVDCLGAAAVHDIQMSQLPQNSFQFITDPVPVFRFDFSGKTPLRVDDHVAKEVAALKSGNCEVVFMWWELQMDCSNDIVLSCAPVWNHPEPLNMQWRDHWMQAIYYLPRTLQVTAGEVIVLHALHDEYSMWFNTSKLSDTRFEQCSPVCTCMMHCVHSRSRLAMMNDSERNEKYVYMLKKYISSSTVCLCLGNGSLLPLLAAKLGAKKVFAVEPHPLQSKIIESYVVHNSLEEKVNLINKQFEILTADDLQHEMVDIVISEPYFATSVLPWDALYFWYLRTTLAPLLKKDAIVIPQTATVRGVAVEFEDLWKIRAPVVEAEGFKLSSFDNMVQKAISLSDELVEPHPLWEYKCKPMTDVFDLITFDISKAMGSEKIGCTGSVPFTTSEGCCNGVVLWSDFKTDDVIITTGPNAKLCLSQQISWDTYSRQGVYFIQPHVSLNLQAEATLRYKVDFNPEVGQLQFSFVVEVNK